ncbi:hypothetical protein SynPROS91_00840 [Synechococcus sp. PROS-9-1]|nr:hypothetical protein SynPROS91_00840 [Synechococcus sp. PROS-9-1]
MINSDCFLVVVDAFGLEATGPSSIGSVFWFIEKTVICSRAVGSLSGTLA